jgi:hypothetical protein
MDYPRNFITRWTSNHTAIRADSFAQAKPPLGRNQWRGAVHEEVVKFGPRLAADLQDVLETSRRHQGDSSASPFQ